MLTTTLQTMATDLMTACTVALNTSPALGAPTRTFVAHNTPIVEGEELTVWVAGVRSAKPVPLTRIGAVKTSILITADLTVDLWRDCWPQPQVNNVSKQLPEPAALTAAARRLQSDAGALWGYVAQLAALGTLFPNLPTLDNAGDVAVGSMTPLGPQGTLVGWRWPFQVKVP